MWLSIKMVSFIGLFSVPITWAFSQTTQTAIKVVYGYHVPNNGKMSDERYAYLVADPNQSFFVTQRLDLPKPENKVTQEDGAIGLKVFDADELGSYVFRDFRKDSVVFREVSSRFMKAIVVTDKWETLPWQLLDDTKTIGSFVCRKATAHFRGRNYTAWFSEQLPMPAGPWKLYGLPGTILEAYDTNKEFYAVAKEVQTKQGIQNEIKLANPSREPSMSFTDYKTYRANFKELYISAIKAKLPRGAGLNLKPIDIKLSPIETRLD